MIICDTMMKLMMIH